MYEIIDAAVWGNSWLDGFLFACAAFLLMVIASHMVWIAAAGNLDQAAAQGIIEAVGLLAAAVVALQIAETIVEEVIRAADISASCHNHME